MLPNLALAESRTARSMARAAPTSLSSNPRRAAQPLIYTLAILLVSSFITMLLVWRFSRPIADLSHAARQVAEGNLKVRVPASSNDELGRLAANFNDMTSELEKKRDIEAQLQQAEKSAVVGRLGSAIAHEIRNPLNVIPPGQRPRVALRFADQRGLLASGLLEGGSDIAQRPVVVDVPSEKGHIVLFANNPIWRGETIGSYGMVLNAILNFDNLNAGRVLDPR